MANIDLLDFGMLLVVASLVAMVSRRIGLPYTAGLVLAGISLALLPFGVDLPLSRELIFNIFLPPLIFEAALQMNWPRFRQEMPLTITLAFLGVAISAAVVAGGLHWLLGWSWIGAGFVGVLIAATDPVSVIAAFKEMKAEPRLGMVVESESLLNDGVAAVGFGILMGLTQGQALTPIGVLASLLWTVVGGIVAGAAVAFIVLRIAGRTRDHLVEITLTTIIAWGGFLLAERIGASGVFAALAAGVIVGNFGWRTSISEAGKPHVTGFWEYAAFLANSVLFLLIGSHEAHQPLTLVSGALAVLVLLTLIGRAAAVYPIAFLFCRSSLRLPATYQHVLVWGGLRGAVGLALALAVPPSVPEQREIVVLTFGVVAFSIFVQGLTMPPLLRRWNLSNGAPGGSRRNKRPKS
ncbi:cation:proton antiporter [Sphingobium chungbukense]|uniref:Sodium:proton exchanger n=1 Tax=Sphingobium chungbukense TaxID=56193 RepID=A0A0M3ANZ5_9SPHN|nr:sodium:proton antiporter [Sphingobium chungbukense]KKW90651.1 sodium:proton exchanger [Sphingobium chungbukense]